MFHTRGKSRSGLSGFFWFQARLGRARIPSRVARGRQIDSGGPPRPVPDLGIVMISGLTL